MPLRIAALLLATLAAFAAERIATPFDAVRALLPQLARPELKSADAKQFSDWSLQADRAIRARLTQGDLDSMVNLLLFGTSFTKQPRMTIENLAAESRAGLLRARLDDLLTAVRKPSPNERIQFIAGLLQAQKVDARSPAAGTYILDQLQRVLKERTEINARIEQQASPDNVFSDRGVSLDTTLFPNYAIDTALGEVQSKGLLKSVARAAIIGPGLDFIDKQSGLDYYPQQTLQPFALQDSLKRYKLGAPEFGELKLTILDISPRVFAHLRNARAKAVNRQAYTIQLPRNGANWLPATLAYWKNFGDALALPANALPVPPSLPDLDTRAVRFPTSAVLALDWADVNIVSQRLNLPAAQRYDLVIATNILVYYTPFEQALALANISAMLKPGGLLLTNDQLPLPESIPMREAGRTEVVYATEPRRGDSVYWYQRQP